MAIAPLNLIYVAHGERMQDVLPEERRLYASVDAGFIGRTFTCFVPQRVLRLFSGALLTPRSLRR